MIQDLPVLTTRVMLGNSKPSIPLNSVNYRVGLQRLRKAFEEPQPLTILNGRSTIETGELIDSFLNTINGDVTVVRIDRSCSNAVEGMRGVIWTAGFDPEDKNLIELDIMFMKFLALQRFQNRRTIFLIEETPDNDSWVRERVRDCVELEAAGDFGLMVILARQTSVQEPFDAAILGNDIAPATIDLSNYAPNQIPSAPLVPSPDEETESGLAEWSLDMESDATIPLKKTPQHRSDKVHDFTLDQPRLMIGRAEDNDLCVIAKNVSRHHAILIRHGAAAVVMDLNSTNGTYVNSQRVKDQVVVHHDIIAIGEHRMRFVASNAHHWDAPD